MAKESKEELKQKLTSLEAFMVTIKEHTELIKKSKQKEERNELPMTTASKATKDMLSFKYNLSSEVDKGSTIDVRHCKGSPNDKLKFSRVFTNDDKRTVHDSLGQHSMSISTSASNEDSSKSLSELAKCIWRKKNTTKLQSLSYGKVTRQPDPRKSSLLPKVTLQSKTWRKSAQTENCASSSKVDKISNSSTEDKPSKSLRDSSNELSILARRTWINAGINSKSSFLNRVNQPHKASVVQLQRKVNCDNVAKNSLEDKMGSKIERTHSSAKQLSELAKAVWKQNKASRSFGRLCNHGLKSFKDQHKSRNEVFKWNSNINPEGPSKSCTFLQRRKHYVLHNSKFKMVKMPLATNNKTESVSSTQTSWNIRYSNIHRKRGFVYRRQTFLYKKSSNQNRWVSKKIVKDTKLPQTAPRFAAGGKGKTDQRRGQFIFTSASGNQFLTDVGGHRLRKASLEATSRLPGTSKVYPVKKWMKDSKGGKNVTRYKITRRQNSSTNPTSKLAASRIVKRRLARIHQQNLRKFVKKQYCMFYNRFGKCKNGDSCKFVHDPDKVAVCTRFLRGTCKNQNCLFSHKVDKRKMPTCSFFLNGACHKDDCPYAHVKVSCTADICKDFQNGFCQLGEECLKRHVLECEQFSKTGTCSSGNKCKLFHRRRNKKRRRSSSLSGTRTPKPFVKKIKLIESKDEADQLQNTTGDELQIKPSFALSGDPEWPLDGFSKLRRRRFNWKTEPEEDLGFITKSGRKNEEEK